MGSASVISLVMLASFSVAAGAKMSGKQATIQIAAMCFKTGEQISGMNKICYYNCLGSTAAITIKSVELCPLSINQ